jgi:hypothetical protein
MYIELLELVPVQKNKNTNLQSRNVEFGIIYNEENKVQTPAILNVIYSGNCFQGNLGVQKPVFSGKLLEFRGSAVSWIHSSSTCIKRNLPAKEKVSATFGSVRERFHCTVVITLQIKKK